MQTTDADAVIESHQRCIRNLQLVTDISTSLNKFAISKVELRCVGAVNAPSLQFPALLVTI